MLEVLNSLTFHQPRKVINHLIKLLRRHQIVFCHPTILILDAWFQIFCELKVCHVWCQMHPSHHHEQGRRLAKVLMQLKHKLILWNLFHQHRYIPSNKKLLLIFFHQIKIHVQNLLTDQEMEKLYLKVVFVPE